MSQVREQESAVHPVPINVKLKTTSQGLGATLRETVGRFLSRSNDFT